MHQKYMSTISYQVIPLAERKVANQGLHATTWASLRSVTHRVAINAHKGSTLI
jgi:hypothetical protein